ncbi:MaoC family dehydratase [Geopseudomonas guangdongensis]|uniref:MaoC like domain-containing protein n=1 Tax=Geopseudomonas guangdongensis TaxID=1245526 RepID=A0A1H2I0P9_9GAMM|nr:MaoC family dehydratase [Pseudomonas guangdongensis]SDU37653.1 MaoC like domain-containing protein [Pseudomonas guangdongensis]
MTSKKTRAFDDVLPGQALPELVIPITVQLITAGAIATRDYFPGHHDKDAARELGSPHVFMNILTTSGLAQRYVEDWAGPGARFQDLKIKLGAPNYPGDSMTFSGEVSACDAASRTVEVTLKGKNSMGNHVTGTATLVLPHGAGDRT